METDLQQPGVRDGGKGRGVTRKESTRGLCSHEALCLLTVGVDTPTHTRGKAA